MTGKPTSDISEFLEYGRVITFSVDGDVISMMNQMMLMNVPRNEELKRNTAAGSLITVRTVALMPTAESHHQIRIIALDHFLLKKKSPISKRIFIIISWV